MYDPTMYEPWWHDVFVLIATMAAGYATPRVLIRALTRR